MTKEYTITKTNPVIRIPADFFKGETRKQKVRFSLTYDSNKPNPDKLTLTKIIEVVK
jgi:hypothetical protein